MTTDSPMTCCQMIRAIAAASSFGRTTLRTVTLLAGTVPRLRQTAQPMSGRDQSLTEAFVVSASELSN